MVDLATKYMETGDMVRVCFRVDQGELENMEGEFIGVAVDLFDATPIVLICEEGKSTFQSVGFDSVENIEHAS